MSPLEQPHAPAAQLLYRELAGEVVLLDLGAGRYFGLDEVAAHLWRAICCGAAPEAAVSTIVAEFEVGEERARSDLQALLQELVARGLAAPAKGGAAGMDRGRASR